MLTLAALTLTATLTALDQIAPPPAPVAAPVSVTVSAGRGRTWDDEGIIGSGTSVGAGVEFRFRPKWTLGADVERLAHHRNTPGLEWSGRTVFASVNIAYRFAARGVSPYVGGGFGGAFHEGTTIARFGPGQVTSERSSGSTMEYGTVGVEIPVGERFAISPDVRITLCQPPDDSAPWATTRFAVKAAIRF